MLKFQAPIVNVRERFQLGIIEISVLCSVPKFSICKTFYRKVLLFEANSLQSLTNFNIKKLKMFL